MLWVDTWLDGEEGRQEEAAAIVEAFRPFWESQQHKKVLALGWGRQGGGRRLMPDTLFNGTTASFLPCVCALPSCFLLCLSLGAGVAQLQL